MPNKMIPLFLLCETPLHVGVGSDVGIVDMPIQRERHTNWPKIEASGIKGSIRSSFEMKYRDDNEKIRDINILFGYDDNGLNEDVKKLFNEEKDFSGALGFTDARVLLFPVKSLKGVFAWVTCPAVLDRFFSDLNIALMTWGEIFNGLSCDEIFKKLDIPNDIYDENMISSSSACLINGTNKIILEEFTVKVEESEKCKKLGEWLSKTVLSDDKSYEYLREKLKNDIVILSNDLFTEFTSLSTEIITRTKIDNETGTVKSGALFTEEYLPTETIMYSFAILSPIFSKQKGSFEGNNQLQKIEEFFRENLERVIQIGGNSTLGKGIVSTHVFEVKQNG